MQKYERLQALLRGIREHYCDDNAAALARKLERSESYVNRLFYPAGKSGAKGIGPAIMDACTKAFHLPRGFWDMEPAEAFSAASSSSQASVAQKVTRPSDESLAASVARVASALKAADRATRISLVPLFSLLATEPEGTGDIAQQIVFLLSRSPSPQTSSENRSLPRSGRLDFGFNVDGEEHGTSDSTEEQRPAGKRGAG